MPKLKGLKVSCLYIANMMSFVNTDNFFNLKSICIMTSRVAHWDTLDERLVF